MCAIRRSQGNVGPTRAYTGGVTTRTGHADLPLHGGRVPAWLARRKSMPSTAASSAPEVQKQRREIKSMAARLGKIEKRIDRLQAKQAELEQRLCENSIYADEQRETLESTLTAQAETRGQLQQAEQDWLELSEALESLEQVST